MGSFWSSSREMLPHPRSIKLQEVSLLSFVMLQGILVYNIISASITAISDLQHIKFHD